MDFLFYFLFKLIIQSTYHFYTWTDDINIRKLLIVKAFALKQMSIDDFIYEFNFEDEMKLLQLDM